MLAWRKPLAMPQPKSKTICRHCRAESANDKVCTNPGCKMPITAPVRLFARVRKSAGRAVQSSKAFERNSAQ